MQEPEASSTSPMFVLRIQNNNTNTCFYPGTISVGKVRRVDQMNVCDSGHGQVVFEGLDCPVCELESDNQDLQNQIVVLEEKVKDLEKEIESADACRGEV